MNESTDPLSNNRRHTHTLLATPTHYRKYLALWSGKRKRQSDTDKPASFMTKYAVS